MKKYYLIILLILSAVVGSFFSSVYLIVSTFSQGVSPLLNYISSIVNSILFYGSLIFIFISFFYKIKFKKFYGIVSIVLGLPYLLLMFSLPAINFNYLIPFILYILTGILVLINK